MVPARPVVAKRTETVTSKPLQAAEAAAALDASLDILPDGILAPPAPCGRGHRQAVSRALPDICSVLSTCWSCPEATSSSSGSLGPVTPDSAHRLAHPLLRSSVFEHAWCQCVLSPGGEVGEVSSERPVPSRLVQEADVDNK